MGRLLYSKKQQATDMIATMLNPYNRSDRLLNKHMKTTLIHNPSAGFENPGREELTRILSKKGYDVTYVDSKKGDMGEALKNPEGLVIVAGGDGTITEAAGYLLGKNVPLAVLALGTANNIAATFRDLGLSPPDTADQPTKGYVTDVGTVTGKGQKSYFFESSGFGLFARSIAESAKRAKDRKFRSRREKIEFALDILNRLLPGTPAVYYDITLDGKDYSGEYIMVEAMNIKSIGPNIVIAPDADPGDGLFDVVLLTDEDRTSLTHYINQLMDGKQARFEKKTQRASHISIRSQQPEFHIDDELSGVTNNGKIEFSLEARQLKIAWAY